MLPPPATCLQQNIGFSANNEPALRFVPELPRAHLGFPRFSAKEKDPGSAFGPEAVPLATGLVPVVYWVPGPFPGPTPRPASPVLN